MLTNRIMGAFTFRKGVYAEVEKDASRDHDSHCRPGVGLI